MSVLFTDEATIPLTTGEIVTPLHVVATGAVCRRYKYETGMNVLYYSKIPFTKFAGGINAVAEFMHMPELKIEKNRWEQW
jgi:hypothetical protein